VNWPLPQDFYAHSSYWEIFSVEVPEGEIERVIESNPLVRPVGKRISELRNILRGPTHNIVTDENRDQVFM